MGNVFLFNVRSRRSVLMMRKFETCKKYQEVIIYITGIYSYTLINTLFND